MTSTLTRTSQAVAEWSKVFPRQATETYTSSVTFIKQLTVVAVSTITYLKNAFPEDNYTIDQFGGLKIRVLKNKCEDELAQFLISALTQAFEAFDKKYLHQMALCFYEQRCSPETLVEYHLFEYAYGGEGASLSVRSWGGPGAGTATVTLDAVRDRTVQLLRACMVMLSHTQLPETYDVSLRLYYNDDAPDGYQAPGFFAAGLGPDGVVGSDAEGRVKLGSVHTPFHRLQLHTFHRDLRATTPDASETTQVLSEHPDEEAGGSETAAKAGAEEAPPSAAPSPQGAGQGGAGQGAGEGGAVRCECARDDRAPHMLLCSTCNSLQHAVCYGVRGAASLPTPHRCVACAERLGTSAGTDAGLLRAANRTCYAIFRRALCWVSAGCDGAVSVSSICGALRLGAGSARKLLRVLRAHGVVAADAPADMETTVEVVPSQLEAALARYFHTPHSPSPSPAPMQTATDDVVTQLLEQSQCSQQSDPLTEVLSPLERVSLQAAANTGTVLEHTAPPSPNPTLAAYRAALAPLQTNTSPPPPAAAPRKRAREAATRRAGVRTKRMRKTSKD